MRPQHLGDSGGEKGRDVIAYKITASGEELWYFQCKRHKEIGAASLKAEVDKYNELAASDPAKRPTGIVFVISTTLSPQARDTVRAYCDSHGYACDFWARSELDMLVKKHPDIVAEFFGESHSPAPPTLHQLPPPPRDFAGRSAELSELTAAAERGTAVLGLFGMGGVGKTTLALKLAERLTSRYQDAQIYLDLKGTSREPLRPLDVMIYVIRSYLPSVVLPHDKSETEALYRSVLHGRRAILLLDNAACREQIEDLIPPTGCLLLVTSRGRFQLPGIVSVRVEPLPQYEADALLLSIAPNIGDQKDTIAELCGHLPLALRLAASALAERADLNAADYARLLSDTRKRLKLVEASFRLSYDLLTPIGRRLWRRLGVFPGTFDADGAAHVWEVDVESARMILSEMVRFSLLSWDSSSRRYRLHDLARLYALKRLRGAERRESYIRYVNYYGVSLQEANSLYMIGGAAIPRAFSILEAEWENIRGAQAWTRENTETDKEAAEMCNAFPNAGAYVLDLRQHPFERIEWLEAALKAARTLISREFESAHLTNLGIAYTAVGDPRRAIELLESALIIARELADDDGQAKILGSLGSAYASLGEPKRAAEFYEQDLAIFRKSGDSRNAAAALCNLGNSYKALGETEKAFSLYEEALAIFQELGDLSGEGAVLGSLGLLYSDLGETLIAVQLHGQAISIFRTLGNVGAEGQELGNMGQSLCWLDDYQGALECHKRQLAIARGIHDRQGEASALSGLGSVYFFQHKDQTAVECYEQAIKIYREIGDRYMESRVLGNWGNMYVRSGNTERALEFYTHQLVIARETGDRRGEANACWNTGWALAKQGDLARAVEHGEIAEMIYEEIGDKNQVSKLRKHLIEWRRRRK